MRARNRAIRWKLGTVLWLCALSWGGFACQLLDADSGPKSGPGLEPPVDDSPDDFLSGSAPNEEDQGQTAGAGSGAGAGAPTSAGTAAPGTTNAGGADELTDTSGNGAAPAGTGGTAGAAGSGGAGMGASGAGTGAAGAGAFSNPSGAVAGTGSPPPGQTAGTSGSNDMSPETGGSADCGGMLLELLPLGLPCEYELPQELLSASFDPERFNVQLEAEIDEAVGHVDSLEECGADPGWSYDSPQMPSRVVLCPASCLLASPGLPIFGEVGCDTLQRAP